MSPKLSPIRSVNANVLIGLPLKAAVIGPITPGQMYEFASSIFVYIAGIILFGFVALSMYQNWQIDTNGIPTTAKILYVPRQEQAPLATYSVSFVFVQKDIANYSITQEMDWANASRFQYGQIVQVHYKPELLSKARIENTPDNYLPFIIGGIVFFGVGLITTIPTLLTLQGFRRLRSQGQILTGQIIQMKRRKWFLYGAGGGFIISYRFTSPTGKELGKTEEIVSKHVKNTEQLPMGYAVPILYYNDRTFAIL
jgi:hypothetical protein